MYFDVVYVITLHWGYHNKICAVCCPSPEQNLALTVLERWIMPCFLLQRHHISTWFVIDCFSLHAYPDYTLIKGIRCEIEVKWRKQMNCCFLIPRTAIYRVFLAMIFGHFEDLISPCHKWPSPWTYPLVNSQIFSYRKSPWPSFIGKPTINGPCSIAILNYLRVIL